MATSTSTRTWVAGAAGAAVLLGATAWFGVIAPQRAEADSLTADTASTEAANDVLAASVEQLRAGFVELPDRQAELATAQQALPTELALSALTRQVAAQAEQAGVTLMSLAPSTPGGVDTAAAAEAATTEPAATEPATDGTAAAATTAAAGTAVPTPVQIQVVGALAKGQLFLQSLQTGTRDLLVTDLSVVAEAPATDGGGRPATVLGDVTLTVTALAFVLPDAAPAAS